MKDYSQRLVTAPGNPDDAKMRQGGSCPLCGEHAPFWGLWGLIGIDPEDEGAEAWRLDCPNGHTSLVLYTDEMGDEYWNDE